MTYVRKDGSHFTVNLMATGLRDESNHVVGFLGIAMDISARKKAEAATRASEEHFRLLVEVLKEYAVIMLDASGHVISWNLAAERINGYKPEEIMGRHFSCFYSPADIENKHPDAELRIAAKQGRYTEEGWHARKDGTTFLSDIVIAPIYDDAGKLRGFAKVEGRQRDACRNRPQSAKHLTGAVRAGLHHGHHHAQTKRARNTRASANARHGQRQHFCTR